MASTVPDQGSEKSAENRSQGESSGVEPYKEPNLLSSAEQGTAATDEYGNAIFKFDQAAERRLRWKIDLYVVPTAAILYLFCFIDRANIGNARLAGLERDLGLQGYDYNVLLTTFYISSILFEIPCNLLCKWMKPGWFLPATSLGFGIMSLAMAYVNNLAQAGGVRFLLGLFEAGVLPGIAYYMSRWYRRSELAFRLSLYVVMAPLAGAFGGLLASGILKLEHTAGLREWRMIFFIEGIVTIGVALISFFTLTDRPETAKWLNEEEKALAIARVKSERVGTTVVLDKMDTPKIMRGLLSPVNLATAWIYLLVNVTVQGLGFFLPSIVGTIYPTRSVIYKQVRTVPPYLVGGFFTLLFPFLSWRMDKRNLFFVICSPLVMIGYIIFLATNDPRARYAATFLIGSGAFSFGALGNAQVSANVVSDTARSSAIGLTATCGNIGGLISTWSFLPFDGPNYPIGNGLNLATSSTLLITGISLWIFMTMDNKRRDKVDVAEALRGLSQKEIDDLDWKHPGFRWKP